GRDGLRIVAEVAQVRRRAEREGITLGAYLKVEYPIRSNSTGGDPLVLHGILIDRVTGVGGLEFGGREATIRIGTRLYLDHLPNSRQAPIEVGAVRLGGDVHREC